MASSLLFSDTVEVRTLPARWSDGVADGVGATPPKGSVDVIAISMDGVRDMGEALYGVLADSEQERATAMRHAASRQSYTVGRAVLRLVLALCTALPVKALGFARGRYGKLYLANRAHRVRAPHFNVSHSGGWTVIALARSRVGVDIERRRRLRAPGAIAAHLGHGAVELSGDQVLRCWCRTEAVVKAYGAAIMHGGMALPYERTPASHAMLRSPLPARLGSALRRAERREQPYPRWGRSSLYICDLPFGEGWYGALAVRGVLSPQIRYWMVTHTGVRWLLERAGVG